MISCYWVIRTLQLKPECAFKLLVYTPDMRQSKMLFTIDERGSKIFRIIFFDFILSQVGWQMAIENSVSKDLLSSIVLTFSIAALLLCFTFERKF